MITIKELADILLWSAIVNYVVLTIWWLFLMFARDWMYQLHGRWFQLTHNQFDCLHYALLGGYKLGIFLLFLGPWIAIQVVI